MPSHKSLKRVDRRYLSETITMEPGVHTLLPLGIAMKVPEGYEIILTPRSSTFINHGVFQSNSIGIIDNTYCGDEDLLYFPAYATRKVTIHAGTRICQFRVQLSQCNYMAKTKWLLMKQYQFEEVRFGNTNRGDLSKENEYINFSNNNMYISRRTCPTPSLK